MSIKTRIYCCGGAGTNLGQQLNPHYATHCYIDTSQSNRTAGLDLDLCHFIEGLDGSGKNRRENYAPIAKEVQTVLNRFPAGDFNIVLFSAAGGSGSVIGPLVLKGLLEAGFPAVAVVIGSDDSAIAVTNTINTLKSLESISVMAKQPVVMAYLENTVGVSRGQIDQDVLFMLESLGVLTSQENRELDTKDLTNWVQYQKVCAAAPQLSALSVYDNRTDASSSIEPISIASLYADPSKDTPFGNPHYATVGYPELEAMHLADQLHFVINHADIEETFKHLTERQTQLNRAFSSYRQRKAVVDVDDSVTPDGLVI